jgi:tRNA (mo5U34)-methyltransferase
VATTTERSRHNLAEAVKKLDWVHRIDLGHGVVTPGTWGEKTPEISRALDDAGVRGKKVLDIGCWDGLWSFEAEKRGAAEVYATDLVTQRRYSGQPTFRLAHKALGSRARYFPDVSVHDVGRLGVRDFDLVIYAGVYYHLRDPLRSFAMLRRVMKEGGTLLVEGAVLDQPGCFAKFYYEQPYLTDLSNWWVPTVACLEQWVESSFFEVVARYGLWDAGGGNLRTAMVARAIRRADARYIRPDDDLSDYDLNDYPRVSQARHAWSRWLPSRLFRARA